MFLELARSITLKGPPTLGKVSGIRETCPASGSVFFWGLGLEQAVVHALVSMGERSTQACPRIKETPRRALQERSSTKMAIKVSALLFCIDYTRSRDTH